MIDIQKYCLSENASIKDALIALNNLSGDVQTLFVLDEKKCMVGTLTDGDIRRKLIEGSTLEDKVTMAMHRQFRYIEKDNADVANIKQLREMNIVLLPSLDKDKHIVHVYNLKKHLSILPLDAVLMAGGKGERLRPLTERTPKPLLLVGDKSIIDYNVDSLINFGVENISITVNYLKEQIEDHFKEPREGIQVNCIRENDFLGTIGAVKNIDTFKNDVVLVMNSDLFTNIDYEDFYLDFLNSDADMAAAAIPYSVNVPYGIFELDGQQVQGVREKPTFNYYANAGIYLIKRKLLDIIPEKTFYNATDFMEAVISKGFKVTRFSLTGYWIDIGKLEDYKKAQEFAKHL